MLYTPYTNVGSNLHTNSNHTPENLPNFPKTKNKKKLYTQPTNPPTNDQMSGRIKGVTRVSNNWGGGRRA